MNDVSTARDAAWHDQLMSEYRHRIYAYLRRGCGNESDAEDLTQDTMLQAWTRRDRVPDDPIGWLLVTARYRLLEHWRRHNRRQLDICLDDAGQHLEQLSVADCAASVADRLEAERILGRVSASDRRLLTMRFLHDRSSLDMAEVLGMSPSNVRAHLTHAIRRAAEDPARKTKRKRRPPPQSPSPQPSWSLSSLARRWHTEPDQLHQLLHQARHVPSGSPAVTWTAAL